MKLSKKVFEGDQVVKGIIPVGDEQCHFDYEQLEQAIKDVVKEKLHYKGNCVVWDGVGDTKWWWRS
jgi:hypothetical protein